MLSLEKPVIERNPVNALEPGKIGPVTRVCSTVFTAEGIAPSGEPIYFALETIENSDKTKWEAYKNSASNLVNGSCCDITFGSLVEIGSRASSRPELMEFLSTRHLPKYWSTDKSKFEQLLDKLKERHIVVESSKAKELETIPHASSGINLSKQTHIAYISKSPVTDRIHFESIATWYSGYVDKYSDLVMTVGVTISDVVENRGIFRNPLSVVEGGYSALSMMIHSFTCMVVEENWPSVETFRVRPLKKMGELFLNSLPKNQITVNGIPGDEYDGGFEYEQDVRVSVRVLADLHRMK